MKKVLIEETEIKGAIELFRKKIQKEFSGPIERDFAFPGGGTTKGNEYHTQTKYGKLTISFPNDYLWNSNRIPHLLNLDPSDGKHSPDVELNIALGLNRNISGCFVRKDNDLWVCSRGKFTSYKSAIKKVKAFSHFQKWLITVEDDKKENEIIPIAALSFPSISEQLSNFVYQVKILKNNYKENNIPQFEKLNKKWTDFEEYEGRISKSNKSRKTEYEYLHGPICNQLTNYLKQELNNFHNFEVKSNKHVDAALLSGDKAKAIFEVKTSFSLSEQIYKAIGQLYSYRIMYNSPQSHLFLIVPNIDECDELITEILNPLDIHIFYQEKDEFKNQNGEILSNFIKSKIS